MEELPKLYASRIDYIKPCVNTLIGGQAKFYEEYSQFYESILKDSPISSNDSDSAALNKADLPNNQENRDYVNMPPSSAAATTTPKASNTSATNADSEVEKLSNEIQQCLKEIKSLSIVASD